MIQFIKHRCNRIEDLEKVEPGWGVEIDLRSSVDQAGALHLSHDTWSRGEPFELWLEAFRRRQLSGPILLNTKEDGLESQIRRMLAENDIDNYLFLDTTLPTTVKLLSQGERRVMVRHSCFEPTALAEALLQKEDLPGVSPEWLWIDCFFGKPVDASKVKHLKKHYKFCLVSPELHGIQDADLSKFWDLYRMAAAICTKVPERWIEFGEIR